MLRSSRTINSATALWSCVWRVGWHRTGRRELVKAETYNCAGGPVSQASHVIPRNRLLECQGDVADGYGTQDVGNNISLLPTSHLYLLRADYGFRSGEQPYSRFDTLAIDPLGTDADIIHGRWFDRYDSCRFASALSAETRVAIRLFDNSRDVVVLWPRCNGRCPLFSGFRGLPCDTFAPCFF